MHAAGGHVPAPAPILEPVESHCISFNGTELGTSHGGEAVEVLESDPTLPPSPSPWRAFYAATVALALGILGSTVLPVPYAFSKTGVLAGCCTMAVVAAANDVTNCMMIRAAAHTGISTYEELAGWAGGPKAQVFSQISLILLLYGTMCGGLAFLSDVARVLAKQGLGPGLAPELLMRDGRPLMLVMLAGVLLPLCLQRHIRQFEKAATAGVVVVVALCAVIVWRAVDAGFPALASGELSLVDVKLDGHLPEAFAVLGFGFYIQPMVMPLRKEMPPGQLGTRLTERAVHITLWCVACGVYGIVGIFGAATYGQATESNIMVNDLLPGRRTATAVLYVALLAYLCCGMVMTHYALRASLDLLLAGPGAPFTWARHTAETLGILGASAAVALAFPTQAEKIFALTGCTAVCLVCYVIPVTIHVAHMRDLDSAQAAARAAARAAAARRRKAAAAEEGGAGASASAPLLLVPLLPSRTSGLEANEVELVGEVAEREGSEEGYSNRLRCTARACCRYSTPVAVVAVGVGFSVAGLYVGFVDLLSYLRDGTIGSR
ncbi:hypothetical protein HYH03_005078 [Edaphochlamys debaryana]|uniref:Amino acid transporter transmembrane domain-containing protein n=1 Tax=Edaphochlamys debaryana TaxID=47281 RepID=A0A835Y8I5_9CHLO|nr:hypothetical protein HYH03_005078 [Edaphochlamys debaryana]|eukprot:KAG2497084.1 hypothetical protein HYH03_005078 [Edaphochlamys debaryana]